MGSSSSRTDGSAAMARARRARRRWPPESSPTERFRRWARSTVSSAATAASRLDLLCQRIRPRRGVRPIITTSKLRRESSSPPVPTGARIRCLCAWTRWGGREPGCCPFWVDQSNDGFEQRGFAAPVGSDYAGEAAGFHGERYVMQGDRVSVADGEVLEGYGLWSVTVVGVGLAVSGVGMAVGDADVHRAIVGASHRRREARGCRG